MGKPCFSKLTKFFAFALLGVATAIAAVAVLSSPASADPSGGGGGDSTLKSWDTDNLKYGGYSARSFAIPHMSDSDRGSSGACAGGGVADAFFQNNSARNDMPELVVSSDGGSVVLGSGHATCSDFVAEQVSAKDGALSNGGYYLDRDGILRNGLAFHHYPRGYSTGRWISGDTRGAHLSAGKFVVPASSAAVVDADYKNRVDYTDSEGSKILRGPAGVAYLVPSPLILNASQNGNTISWVPDFSSAPGVRASNALVLSENRSRRLCPAGLHPRGEDAARRIGTGTGRTLSSLTLFDETQTADQHWCRSDARHAIKYELEVIQGKTCGTGGNAKSCPSGVGDITNGEIATAYGRVNCYYTTLGDINTAQENSCDYIFPVPQCTKNATKQQFTAEELSSYTGRVFPFNTDGSTSCPAPQCTDNGSKRNMTNAELAEYRKDDASFTPKADGSTPCSANPDGPPQQAGFTADPCVTADLDIYENRIVGSAAEPGVPASDRTLVVAAGRTAWDLDITSPHHNTASPPRDTTSTPADATGCADGSEDRADHSSDAGSAARKNTDAGVDLALPASSVAAQSTHPPHSKGFDSAGTDYTGAVRNIAHRYASNVAENTCAAKRAEAEMVLSEMKARRLAFQRYIDSYQSRIDAALSTSAAAPLSFGNYSTKTQTGSDLGVDVLRYNAIEANHLAYVNARKDHLELLETAVDKAETQYGTDTSGLSVPSAVPNNGCVARYDSAITALRKKIDDAETDFATVARTAGKKSVSGHLSDFNRVNLAADPAAARVVVPTVSRPAYSWSDGSSSTAYSCPSGGRLNSSKSTCTPTITETQNAKSTTTYNSIRDDDCWNGLTEEEKNSFAGFRCFKLVSDTDYSCPAVGEGEVAWSLSGSSCSRTVDGTPYTSTVTVTTSQSYSVTDAGTVKGYFPSANSSPDKSQTFTVTFTGTRTKTVVNSGTPSYSNRADSNDYATKSKAAKDIVKGSPPTTQSALPGFAEPSITARTDISNLSLLGKYHPQHPDRANLKATSAADRDTAAANLGSLSAGNITTAATGATTTPQNIANTNVPTIWGATGTTAATRRSDLEIETNDYKIAYTRAYNTAYRAALSDMGTTATTTTWNNFDWRYQTSTLAWENYQEDPATTYSASTATPRDGTGCDLIAVASDGTVSVEATRLDYETSSYGKGSVYSTRTDAQRTCKIRRTRTPELLLMYAPAAPPTCTAARLAAKTVCGTDTSKTADSILDTNEAKTNAEFYYVDYQPAVAAGQTAAERFKLYDEAEVFAVETSLADSNPVLCYQPGEALVAHVGARGIDTVNKAVFRNASGFAGGNKKHCYRHPSSAQLGSPRRPAFVFFDDTAHSAMASVNVVWQQPSPKIVSKLGSADDLKMMANTVSLVASSPVAYVDATRTSSFYGTYYTFPTDTSTESPSGWDITGHPSLTLTSTFEQHQVQAKDAAAKTPSTHSMVFKFIDCVFGIEDVAFVDNIASPYALLSDENGVVPSGWKQTYDSDPHNSPTWYYPAFSTYEGARRLDGRRNSNGDPITYGRNTQGGFAHPSYDLENTAADGIGWGIVYEDKVGKQQPVWAVYAPPVPGDNPKEAPTRISDLSEARHILIG